MVRNYSGFPSGKALSAALEKSDYLKKQEEIAEKLGGYTTKEGSDAYFKFALENIKNYPKDFLTRSLLKLGIVWAPAKPRPGGSRDLQLKTGAYFLVAIIFLGMYFSVFIFPNLWSWLLLFYIWIYAGIHTISRARFGHDLVPFISLAAIFGAWFIFLIGKTLFNIIKKTKVVRISRIKSIIVILTIVILIGGTYGAKDIISVVILAMKRTPPTATASFEKIDSNQLSVRGTTQLGTLIFLEDNGKEIKEIKINSQGEFSEILSLPPGEHNLILKFYDRAYNLKEIKKNLIIE
jgi:hypothetical protein